MILPYTIERIKEAASLKEVISKYVPLKEKGRLYTGCCPFHNEKSASFTVDDDRGFYKCFGCGKGGDVFSFLQEHLKLSFYEAADELAKDNGITLELEKQFTKEEIDAKKERAKQIEQILSIAESYYHNQLLSAPDEAEIWEELRKRKFSRETVIEWRIGWAPESYDNIKTTLLEKGLGKPAVDIGILGEKNGNTYDKYRGRIIIPSLDHRGQLNGFIGRLITKNDKYAKYINPAASEVYNKSIELFGLSTAIHHIKAEGFAYLVEGNLDVITMHSQHVKNTICPGGTSLTPEQCRMLKRYTDAVTIMTDGDPAGEKAAMKWIDELLRYDFRVNLIELPAGEDPDSYINKLDLKYS